MNAYTVTCKEMGLVCPGSFTTESKEELVEHVQLHARKAHQKDISSSDIEPMIKIASMV